MGGIWDAETFALVRTLWNEEGKSATAIADRIGTSRNAVLGKIHRFRDEFKRREPVALGRSTKQRARVTALKTMAGEVTVRPRVEFVAGIDHPSPTAAMRSALPFAACVSPSRGVALGPSLPSIDSQDRSPPPVASTASKPARGEGEAAELTKPTNDPVPLAKLTVHHCRGVLWGDGPDVDGNFMHCGAPVPGIKDVDYCAWHQRLMYRRPNRFDRDAARPPSSERKGF